MNKPGSVGGGDADWEDFVSDLKVATDDLVTDVQITRPATPLTAQSLAPVPAPTVRTPAPPAATTVRTPTRPPAPGATMAGPSATRPTAPPTQPSATQPSPQLGEGTRIGQYELIRELGAGGMGTVYLARDLRLGRRVAIKFLQSKDASTTHRFIVEARATASCSHENIIIIYEVGEHHGSPFMVLEYLQGQPLSKVLENAGKLPPQRAVDLMMPVVRALVCAHEQGIVHRDLKPDNIFVTDGGTIKVLDFGIAKVVQGEVAQNAKQTRQGAVVGTVKYMSPEQWGIGVEIDPRTDIWAVGVMLFEMLSGRHPLPDDTAPMLTAVMQQPMLKLRDVAREVPANVANVVDRCLNKDREQRYPDAKGLLRALEPFLPGHFTGEITADASPYAGLSSFQETDAARFFGRSREIAMMVSRIRERPLMGVIGPSGIGKSSLVRAGLVPALKKSGEAWEIHVLRPGRSPLQSLASLLLPLAGKDLPVTGEVSKSTGVSGEAADPKELAERLRTEPGLLGNMLRRHARAANKHVLLFIDQFEELYTMVADVAERLAFTAALSGLADDATSPARVMVSVRSDFLDRISEDKQFMNELSQQLFFLSAPDREGLRDALVQPAERVGYRFESAAIVDDMLNHLATTASALPLLQFAASKLWETRDPQRRLLTAASYTALGGIAGALASHADAVLAQLSTQSRTLARSILLRLVTSERTRAIVTLDELEELSKDTHEIRQLVDQLVTARLLVVQTGDGGAGATVEIVHESLIHGWPQLQRWLDEGQEDAGFLEQLRAAAKQWVQKGRAADLLWRGELVEEAARFSRRYRGELGLVQRDFLKAVFDLDARASRRRRQVAIGGGVILALLLVAAVVALVIIRDAQKTAEASAVIARQAETQAKQRLVEVQTKEIERQRAEAEKKLAEVATAKANTQVERTNEELAQKNEALQLSLANADSLRRHAESAQRDAEHSAADARASQEAALAEKKKTESLLKREQERSKRLQQQLGSPLIDDLK